MVSILPDGVSDVANMDLLTLNMPKFEDEISFVCVLGNYMDIVWKHIHRQGIQLKREKLFGFLKYKYRTNQLGARSSMLEIPALSFQTQ